MGSSGSGALPREGYQVIRPARRRDYAMSRPDVNAAVTRNAGDGVELRSRSTAATRSHAQRREHGADGEHRLSCEADQPQPPAATRSGASMARMASTG